MKNFGIFMLGFLVTGSVLVGAGLYFLKVPETARLAQDPKDAVLLEPKSAEQAGDSLSPFVALEAKPAANPPGGVSLVPGSLLVSSTVVLPAQVEKLVKQYPDATLTVLLEETTLTKGKLVDLLLEGRNIVGMKYPYSFRFLVAPPAAEELRRQGAANLTLRAVLCYDRPKDSYCGLGQRPHVIGGMPARVTIPNEATRPLELSFPPLVINKLVKKIDPAACTQSGGQISGFIEPTAKFLNTPGQVSEFEVIASPWFKGSYQAPFYSVEDQRDPLTASQLSKLADSGIVLTHVSIRGPERVPFKIALPEKFRSSYYRFFAIPCREGDTPEDCAARAFPIPLAARLYGKNGRLFVLPPKDFSTPRCGDRESVLYLHAWDFLAPPPKAREILQANPPEVIEGAFY